MRRSLFSHIVTLGSIAACYTLAGKFGLSFAFLNASSSAVWPPSGIALAALAIFGVRVWPAVFIGAFLVNFSTAGSLAASAGIAIGNTGEALVAAALIRRYANGPDVFTRPQDFFTFVLSAAVISTAIGATIGGGVLALTGLTGPENPGSVWITWWLGDANGILIVFTLIVLWWRDHRIRWRKERVFEAAILLVVMVSVTEVIFGAWHYAPVENYPLSFVCVPVLIWVAFRFGPRETSVALLIVSVVAISASLRGTGPFVLETANESLVILQAFLSVNAVMALALASVVSQRRQSEEALERARAELEARVSERTADLSGALEALRKNEEMYKDLVDNANDIIYRVDTHGRITYINPTANKILKYGSEEILGRRYLDFVKPEYRDTVGRYFRRQFVRRTPNTYYEAPALAKDGTVVWLGQHVHLLTENGEIHGFQAVSRDITERKIAEERIQMLVHTITSANDCVVITNMENTIIFVNPAFLRTYGYEEDEILGKNISLVRPPGTPEALSQNIQQETRRKGWQGEIINVRKNGEEFPILLSTSIIYDTDHRPTALVGISRDITEQKRLQKSLEEIARQRTEDLIKFSASVQGAQEEERRRIARELHDDLGQRLSGMKFNIEVFEDEVPASDKKTLSKLRLFKRQIDSMITEIRRISSNLHPSALDDFGLLVALQFLCKEFEKMCRIPVRFESGEPEMTRYDPRVEIALYRMTQEALSNISKHARASSVKVCLTRNGPILHLTVTDDGQGFDPGTVNTRRQSDRGLGLISMRERSEHFGGKFRIESEIRNGTTLHVEIPVNV